MAAEYCPPPSMDRKKRSVPFCQDHCDPGNADACKVLSKGRPGILPWSLLQRGRVRVYPGAGDSAPAVRQGRGNRGRKCGDGCSIQGRGSRASCFSSNRCRGGSYQRCGGKRHHPRDLRCCCNGHGPAHCGDWRHEETCCQKQDKRQGQFYRYSLGHTGQLDSGRYESYGSRESAMPV